MTGQGCVRRRLGGLIALVAALLCSASSLSIAAGGMVTYSYDALGRLSQVTYPNGVAVTYALDPAGNRTSVTTIQPPAAPGVPAISLITASTATANWSAPSGGTAAATYQYTLNGGTNWVSTGSSASANLSNLAVGTQYTVAVRACDAEGGCGAQSSATFDTAPPAPGAVTISNIGGTTATASWGAATDSVGISGYEYSLNGGASWTNVGNPNPPTASLAGLTPATQYTFSVRAYDAAGTRGAASSATFTTPDTIPPSAPGTPTYVNITTASATAQWSAASDNVGVTGYEYSLNEGAWQNIGAVTSFNLTGLAFGTQYTFSVRAYDAAGNYGQPASSSFRTAGFIDTLQMTQGEGVSYLPPYTYIYCYGYDSGSDCSSPFGSLSPEILSGGKTVTMFDDASDAQSIVNVSGFSSDPGQGWLISASATGVTLNGSAATYGYSNGTASWHWFGSGFNFAASGPTTVSLTHY